MTLRNIQDRCRLATLGLSLLVVLHGTAVWAQLPAFPGAEGAGKDAVGGRNGDIYRVTNLNDSGSGSLRFGVDNAPSGGRTIVFEVGGTIDLASRIRIDSPNVTVAGQTAPGEGITLKGHHLEIVDTEDVVVRYLRVRPGDINTAPNVYEPDSISVRGSSDIVIDHVSVSWSTDENLSTTHDSDNVSVQWTLITEALHNSNHHKGNHGYGSLINGGDYSFHHNLYAHNRSRNPRPGQGGSNPTRLDFVNNVIYNPGNKFGYGGDDDTMFMNFAGNYGIAGPDTNETDLFDGDSVNTEIYQSGNFMDLNEDGVLNGTNGGWGDFGGTFTQNNGPRFNLPLVTTQTATQAASSVFAHAGASLFRDAVDTRIIGDALSYGTSGAHIDSQTQVGGWPTLPAGSAPTDTDNDGMPDTWELVHGLNPNSAADRTGDFDVDGYKNVEEYLNDIGAFPSPVTIEFDGDVNERFARTENWSANWQPSRFDTVEISSGSVVVDAVGQHAGVLRLVPHAGQTASFNVTDGWLTVSDEVVIGSDPGATAVLELSGGWLTAPHVTRGDGGALVFTGGGLSADHVDFDLVNQGGILNPGVTTGTLTVTGDYHHSDPASVLELELSGTVKGVDYDVLNVAGELIVDAGTLRVLLGDGFVPVSGDQFDILDAAVLHGQFDALNLPGGPVVWNISQLGTAGIVTYVGVLGGDFNGDGSFDCQDVDALVVEIVAGTNTPGFDISGDGSVDQNDLSQWLANAGAINLFEGAAYLPGDANLDGVVDVSDFNAWNGSKFTATPAWCSGDFNADGLVDVSDFNIWNGRKFTSSADAVAVPEPRGAALVALTGLLLRIRRRRTPSPHRLTP